MKTLTCPHCHTQVPETAGVCTGCGAEIVRGLTRRGRSLFGLLCVAIAIFAAIICLRALEIARGGSPLPSPNAQHGLLVIGGIIFLLVVPYVIGTRAAGMFWRSRIRFYRNYQHR